MCLEIIFSIYVWKDLVLNDLQWLIDHKTKWNFFDVFPLISHDITLRKSKSKVGDHSRGWPEGSLFDSYYIKL